MYILSLTWVCRVAHVAICFSLEIKLSYDSLIVFITSNEIIKCEPWNIKNVGMKAKAKVKVKVNHQSHFGTRGEGEIKGGCLGALLKIFLSTDNHWRNY